MIIEKFLAQCNKSLAGKTILNVRFMTDAERDAMGWRNKSIAIVLIDGNVIFPMCDDEGNDAGALATTLPNIGTIGVLR